ncbi:MAG: hypothetical protein H6999_04840 [Hahellaceae bacterium]|nr:hypothetical protein [Hahellaceae bacterium]MCP5169065.1 hypothetical protein [Hahellaceae bacterium]
MNRHINLITLSALCMTAFSAHSGAGEIDAKISSNSAATEIRHNLQQEFRLGAGYLYHEGGRHVINLGVHATGQTAIANLPTTVAIGSKIYYFNDDPIDGTAVTLGGDVRVNIPEAPGLSAELGIHYAPSILSFGDADDMVDTNFQLNYRVIPKADVSAGYHYQVSEIANKHRTLDEGLFVGVRLHF